MVGAGAGAIGWAWTAAGNAMAKMRATPNENLDFAINYIVICDLNKLLRMEIDSEMDR